MISLSRSGFASKEATVSAGLLLPQAASVNVHKNPIILPILCPTPELGCGLDYISVKRTDSVYKVAQLLRRLDVGTQ